MVATSPSSLVEVVDLRAAFDNELLHEFYDSMMIPSFSAFEDELDPIDNWINQLQFPERTPLMSLHLILVLDTSAESAHLSKTQRLMAGCSFEYYPTSNCGLMAYIVVGEKHRGKGLSQTMVAHALDILQAESRQGGNAQLSALFLETNDDTKVEAHRDVMDPKVRQRILHNLGFRILDYPYVQPALTAAQNNCHDLLLTVHHSFLQTAAPGRCTCDFARAHAAAAAGSSSSSSSSSSIDSGSNDDAAVATSVSDAAWAQAAGAPVLDAAPLAAWIRDLFISLKGEESVDMSPTTSPPPVPPPSAGPDTPTAAIAPDAPSEPVAAAAGECSADPDYIVQARFCEQNPAIRVRVLGHMQEVAAAPPRLAADDAATTAAAAAVLVAAAAAATAVASVAPTAPTLVAACRPLAFAPGDVPLKPCSACR